MSAGEARGGRILLTGGRGQVGSAVLPMLQALGEVYAPGREAMDLADAESVRGYVRRVRPRWIVNTAAYTAVDRAESEPELAEAINAVAPGVMGEEAARMGVPVVHFSTDYVFDGSGTRPWVETDAPRPLSVYGRTKLAGEEALAASGAVHVTLRTSWVFGATGKNFLRTILGVAGERERLRVVDDQHGAPTWSVELARLVAHIVRMGEARVHEGITPVENMGSLGGVYHASSQGETTWFGFAKEIVERARAAMPERRWAEVEAVASSEYATTAARPSNSRLNCDRLRYSLGFQLSHWRNATADVMKEWLEEHRSR